MTEWGPLGQLVYERTYKRPEDADWRATVERVVDGNLALVAPEHIEDGEREQLIEHMLDFRIIPAGRHLWASGADTKLGLYNCHRAGWGPTLAEHFTFLFDQLMLGGGVGANYSTEYMHRVNRVRSDRVMLDLVLHPSHPDYHEVADIVRREPTPNQVVYHVEDSREGWVAALSILLEAYESHRAGFVNGVALDFSAVRERGAPIRGFGGIASGPGPLIRALYEVNDILSQASGYLDPMEAMEIDHALAACVISGNVRRSARMSIMYWNDPRIFAFLNCKKDPSKHWSTNISVEVDDAFWRELNNGNRHATAVLDKIVEGMLLNGEPGIYNSSLAAVGELDDVRCTNPCGEIALEEWEQCCLGHVNLAAFDPNDWVPLAVAFRLMGRFLYRATFGVASDRKQEHIKSVNRRIGVGIFGYQEWAAALGYTWSETADNVYVQMFFETMYSQVTEEVMRYARLMGENPPIKYTTVAPTGTIAKLPGATEGIHPIYARYFIRRVRHASNDPLLANYPDSMKEDDLVSEHTVVVSHYVKDTLLDKVKPELVEEVADLTVDDMLAVQRMIQTHWADNAVSFTCNIDTNTTFRELKDALVRYGPQLKGTTVFPDVSRPQSPNERITEQDYMLYTGEHEIGQSFDDCANGACPIK